MLRLNSCALQKAGDRHYYDGGLYSGVAIDLVGNQIRRRWTCDLGIDVGDAVDPFFAGTPESPAHSMDDPQFDEHIDGGRWFYDHRPLTGRVVEFDGLHQTGEIAVEGGSETRRQEFYRGGALRLRWRKQDDLHHSMTWWDDGAIQSLNAAVVRIGMVERTVAIEFDRDACLTEVSLKGDFLEQGLTSLAESGLGSAPSIDHLLERRFSERARIRGLRSGALPTALLEAGTLDGTRELTLDGPHITAADLSRLCKLPKLEKLVISRDDGRLTAAVEFARRQTSVVIEYHEGLGPT